MQAGKSYLLVRATVADAEERRKFDYWYETVTICRLPSRNFRRSMRGVSGAEASRPCITLYTSFVAQSICVSAQNLKISRY
jgi:hypothetical protein